MLFSYAAEHEVSHSDYARKVFLKKFNLIFCSFACLVIAMINWRFIIHTLYFKAYDLVFQSVSKRTSPNMSFWIEMLSFSVQPKKGFVT